MENIAPLIESARFHYRIGSVTDEEFVGESVERVDVVFHLAAAVGVKLIIDHPTRTIDTNVRGTEVVLRAAAKRGKLVVIASSSEVYGKGVELPYTEDDDLLLGSTTNSRWSYACSKAMGEYLALAYVRERELPVVIVRLFNTVGVRQVGRYGMVLPTFIRQGLAGRDITVYGSGEQTRCFADVSEVVECLIRLLRCQQARGQVFNVGGDSEISINQLAERVRQLTGGRSRIAHLSYQEAYAEGFEDLGRRIPDLHKLERAIGFRPSGSIGTIIRRIIDHERGRC